MTYWPVLITGVWGPPCGIFGNLLDIEVHGKVKGSSNLSNADPGSPENKALLRGFLNHHFLEALFPGRGGIGGVGPFNSHMPSGQLSLKIVSEKNNLNVLARSK